MNRSIRQMQEIQAQRDLERTIVAHRDKQFDLGSLDPTTRHILRRGGVRITAAATIGGMTVSEVDKVLENYFKENPSSNETQTRFGVKLGLQNAGVLLPVHA